MRLLVALASVFLAAALGVVQIGGQEPPRIHDLTDTEPTVEELLDILTADQGPSEPLRSRGLGVAQPPPSPDCTGFHQDMARGLGVKAAPGTGIAALRIHFDLDSAELLPESVQQLEKLGEALTSPGLASSCISIEGHADSLGSEEHNLRLSTKRAEAVARYLVEKFTVDPGRLLIAGHGERQPIHDNATEEGRAKNRRVQIANAGRGDAG